MSLKSPDRVFDELLVLQYQAGDEKAFALLVKRWSPKIIRYAYRNLHDQQTAEDVTQEVWLAAVKGIHRLSDHRNIGSWLLSITHNKSMDWLKKYGGKKESLEIKEEPAAEVTSDDPKINLRRAIKQLNPDQRNVLTLFYLEGYTIQEISEILSLSKGTIKSRLFYARESLKKVIKKYSYER